MDESESIRLRPSKTPKEQLFKEGRRMPAPTPISKFGTVVRALWTIKPALNLAQRSGVTERAAQFYIDGQRRPSWRALRAILDEISE